jgi:dTDP-glucose 4,6-dehydratase
MRALISGGAGFIGSHLCDRFLAGGHAVVALDNLSTGRRENIAHLAGSYPRFEFLEHDVTKPLSVAGGFDLVLHLASPASPKDYQEMPIETLEANCAGTSRMLQLAEAKRARFGLASTSEVYGDPDVTPQHESYWGRVNPVGPRSCYDEGKRYAEAMVMAYHRARGMRVAIARIFNTFGPRMRADDGRVLPNMIGQALRGEPLTIYGKGTQTRSFCYISDLVEGLYRLAAITSAGEPVVNLGNPHEVSILFLASEIEELTGSRGGRVYLPLPEDDPQMRCPDIARAEDLLDWSPRVSRWTGLKRTIEWFRERQKAKEDESSVQGDDESAGQKAGKRRG